MYSQTFYRFIDTRLAYKIHSRPTYMQRIQLTDQQLTHYFYTFSHDAYSSENNIHANDQSNDMFITYVLSQFMS